MFKKGFSTILIVVVVLVVITGGVLAWQYRLQWKCPTEFVYSGVQRTNCYFNTAYPIQTDEKVISISGEVKLEQGSRQAPYSAVIINDLYLFDINSSRLLVQPNDYYFEAMVGKKITVKGYTGRGDIVSRTTVSAEEYIVKTVDAFYVTEIVGWKNVCCDNLACSWFSVKDFSTQIDESNENLPILAEEQQKNFIFPEKEILLPQGYPEQKWEGVLVKCTMSEEPMPWECGACYYYSLVLGDNTQMLFNDEDFEGLEEIVGSKIELMGYDKGTVLISCPKRFMITRIITR